MPSYSENSGRNTLSGFTSTHMNTSGWSVTHVPSTLLRLDSLPYFSPKIGVYEQSTVNLFGCFPSVSADSSDKLRQPKIGALMKQVMGNKDDVPGTFSRGGEERARMSGCVCVCESKGMCVCYPLWRCLMDHICHLTSALGQRAKVISLSQPKVSGRARNPSRGTVGPDL